MSMTARQAVALVVLFTTVEAMLEHLSETKEAAPELKEQLNDILLPVFDELEELGICPPDIPGFQRPKK